MPKRAPLKPRLTAERQRELDDQMLLAASGGTRPYGPRDKPYYEYDPSLVDVRKVRRLIQQGANPLAVDERFGRTLGHWGADHGKLELVQIYHQHGGDLNAKSETGHTLGHTAAENGRADILGYYFGHGGDPHAVNPGGWSIGHSAVAAPPNSPRFKGRRLEGSEECLRLYHQRGGNLNARLKKDGESIAMRAAWAGRTGELRYLLEHGVDPNQKDKRGQKLTDHARSSEMSGLLGVLKMFRDHGGKEPGLDREIAELELRHEARKKKK